MGSAISSARVEEIMALVSLPWHGEDYEESWGFLKVEDKVVLDIGADYGSTAYFFLKKGAKQVIGVESYQDVGNLLAYAEIESRVIGFDKHISRAKDYRELIQAFPIDLMKLDCEGCEAYLLDLDDEWFKKVPEYAIELHNSENARRCSNLHNKGDDLQPAFQGKFERCKFVVTTFRKQGKQIMWAKKKSLNEYPDSFRILSW